jgi:AcrR family transcriptional regulator
MTAAVYVLTKRLVKLRPILRRVTPSVRAGTREAKGAETRQRILEAAWLVIAERGLAGMTTRLVAGEAGISHGMCHYHFQTKEDLVLAVVDLARRYWIDPMEDLMERPEPARRRLDAIVSWMAEPATREVMRVHLQLVAHCEWNEALRARMAGEYARWQAAYVRLFRELAADGELLGGVEPDPAGVAFATLADGLVDQRSLNPALDTEAVMRAFLRPILRHPPGGA